MTTLLEQPPIATEVAEVAFDFRAMNTSVEVLIYTDQPQRASEACYAIESLFEQAEATLSRFRPNSELNQLNRQGYLAGASPLLFDTVQAARQMAALTEGIFDPTILDALEAAGYDRSFELIAGGANRPHLFNPPRLVLSQGWQLLILDPARRAIQLPFGMHLDLGGIAKGATVDRAARLLREAGFTSFMVSAGGDMFVQGQPPANSAGWTVGVENPLALRPAPALINLSVKDQAVATSSIMGRSWTINGKRNHHLIDPRTNQPADNGIAAVTAVTNSVQLSDVLAKTALILGPAAAQAKLKTLAAPVSLLFVTLEGEIIKL